MTTVNIAAGTSQTLDFGNFQIVVQLIVPLVGQSAEQQPNLGFGQSLYISLLGKRMRPTLLHLGQPLVELPAALVVAKRLVDVEPLEELPDGRLPHALYLASVEGDEEVGLAVLARDLLHTHESLAGIQHHLRRIEDQSRVGSIPTRGNRESIHFHHFLP